MKKVTTVDLLGNMIDFIGDFIESLHKKDKKAIEAIIANIEELQDKYQKLIGELDESDEWTQEDLMELAGITLLLAASMGIPETEDSDEENEDEKESDDETPSKETANDD